MLGAPGREVEREIRKNQKEFDTSDEMVHGKGNGLKGTHYLVSVKLGKRRRGERKSGNRIDHSQEDRAPGACKGEGDGQEASVI